MSRRRRTASMPGWDPLTRPRHGAAGVGRWLWWPVVVAGFLALVVYVLGHDQAPGRAGPSNWGLLVLVLAVVVVVVLTVRRRLGPRVLFATLAEYAIVAALVAGLVALSTPDTPARKRGRAPARRPQPTRVEAAKEPGNALEWLADAWRRANETADQAGADPASPPTGGTRP